MKNYKTIKREKNQKGNGNTPNYETQCIKKHYTQRIPTMEKVFHFYKTGMISI